MKLTSFFAIFVLAVPGVLAATAPAPSVVAHTPGAPTHNVAVIQSGTVDAAEELSVRQIRPPANNYLGGVIDLFVAIAQIVKESVQVRAWLLVDGTVTAELMFETSGPRGLYSYICRRG